MQTPGEVKKHLETLEAKFRERTRELHLLQEINNAVMLGKPLAEVLQSAADGVAKTFRYTACDIYLYDKEREEIEIVALSVDSHLLRKVEKLTGLSARGLRIPLQEGNVFTDIIHKKHVLVSNDMVKVFADFTEDRALKLLAPRVAEIFGFKALVRAPLIAKDEVIGLIGVARDKDISEDDVEMLNRFASQVALLIKKVRAEEALMKARDELEMSVRLRTASLVEANEELEREIAERRQAEDRLVQALRMTEDEKAKTEAVVACIGDGISIQGTDFRVRYQNQVHKEIVRGDFTGEYCYVSYAKQDAVCEGCPVAKALEDGGTHTLEKVVPREDRVMHIEIKASPLRDSGGAIIGAIEVVRDVTGRKALEEQLRHAQKMEVIGNLTSGISHEFNNIMTSILGYGEILKDEVAAGSELGNYVDMIMKSATRAVNLTHGLLAYSRKQITNMEPVDVNELLKDVDGMISGLIREDVQFKIAIAEDGTTVLADKGQIEQVIFNLASNALDAMPGGGTLTICSEPVTVREKFTDGGVSIAPGRYARITVSDTGEGIYADLRDRIFEPFFTTKEVGKGTGLGLSVVYGIVKKHKGFIAVDSKPGEGTTFRVYLPVCPVTVGKRQATAAEKPPRGNETVLLAEDDGSVRGLLKQVLEKHGYRVIDAREGRDAVEKYVANRKEVKLLILDVGMPKKSGNDVYGEICRMNPGIKALFVSGYTHEHADVREIFDRNLSFIPKPIMPRELLVKMRELLD